MDEVMNPHLDIPDRLAAAVVQFCRENVKYSHHLSIQGSITIVADDQAIIASIGEKISGVEKDFSDFADLPSKYRSDEWELPEGVETTDVLMRESSKPQDSEEELKSSPDIAPISDRYHHSNSNNSSPNHASEPRIRQTTPTKGGIWVSPSATDDYGCTLCDKSFSSRQALARHIRTHTGDKPHKCEFCGKGFKRSQHLAQHRRTHTGEKPYSCEVCGKLFGNEGNFYQHRRMAHTNEKTFKCKECGKLFRHLASLSIHRRSHQGEKLHACDICGQKFSEAKLLDHHRQTHFGSNNNNNNSHAGSPPKMMTESSEEESSLSGSPPKRTPPKERGGSRGLNLSLSAIAPKRTCRCEFCGEGFGEKYLLDIHRKDKHSSYKWKFRNDVHINSLITDHHANSKLDSDSSNLVMAVPLNLTQKLSSSSNNENGSHAEC